MRFFGFILIATLIFMMEIKAGTMIEPKSVVVLYHSELKESEELARHYAKVRGIDESHLIGLPMPVVAEVSREEYEKAIAAPMRAIFNQRGWWNRARNEQGYLVPQTSEIKVLVTMKGVPLKIRAGASGNLFAKGHPFKDRDDSSVDSELALLGVEGYPLEGGLDNTFYRSESGIESHPKPYMMLTSRIDAPTFGTCRQMIDDVIEVEKTGLWGMCYVDIAQKHAQGDGWFHQIAKGATNMGIPTVVDRFPETYAKGYPLAQCATYFGWYDWHVSGPFADLNFRFKKGAVAVHLHSFSAIQMTSPLQNWCAPLLERGVVATVGNVGEPYLHLTHDLGLLHQRLLQGYTWVEACWMAMPVVSWQGVVIGDPLYRPYLHLSGSGELRESDQVYRLLRAARLEWPMDDEKRRHHILRVAEQAGNGLLTEAVALERVEAASFAEAAVLFQQARLRYADAPSQLRQDLHLAAMDMNLGKKELALKVLRDAQARHRLQGGAEVLNIWIDKLDPHGVKPTVEAPAGVGGVKKP